MEITEPVILEIPQGKRRVRVELTSRADARDLIAAIATAMLRLPDDGVPESRHERHEGGVLDADEFRARIEPMTEADLHVAIIYAHSRCPETIEAAIGDEEETRPVDEPEPVSPELLGQLAGSIITGTPITVDDEGPKTYIGPCGDSPMHPPCDRPELCDCGCHVGTWQALDVAAGAPKLTSLEEHRSVRLLRDGEKLVAVEITPCPEVHPKKKTPCVGGEHHGPPCRDLDGDEWVTAPLAGAL